jgi:hypothetical protein
MYLPTKHEMEERKNCIIERKKKVYKTQIKNKSEHYIYVKLLHLLFGQNIFIDSCLQLFWFWFCYIEKINRVSVDTRMISFHKI